MGGHVLWLQSNLLQVLERIEELMLSEKRPLDDYQEVINPLLDQAALNEQAHIIQKLVENGLTREDVSRLLNRSVYFVDEICDLDLASSEYDYSYIKGAQLFSRKSNKS